MGRFITVDGIDGSGKHTQTELLCGYLRSRGVKVRKLDFPVYDSESSSLVRLYLGGGLGSSPDDTNAYAASMFFAADRYVSFVTDWRADYLDPDTVLVADRYTTANAIHQLSKLPREEWDDFLFWLCDFEFGKLSLPEPDLVIYLDQPPEVSIAMIDSRSAETGRKKDIHELNFDHLFRAAEAGRFACEKLGWTPVGCCRGGQMRTRDEIFGDVKKAAASALGDMPGCGGGTE